MNDEYNGQGGCYTLDKNGNRVPVAESQPKANEPTAAPVKSAAKPSDSTE